MEARTFTLPRVPYLTYSGSFVPCPMGNLPFRLSTTLFLGPCLALPCLALPHRACLTSPRNSCPTIISIIISFFPFDTSVLLRFCSPGDPFLLYSPAVVLSFPFLSAPAGLAIGSWVYTYLKYPFNPGSDLS